MPSVGTPFHVVLESDSAFGPVDLKARTRRLPSAASDPSPGAYRLGAWHRWLERLREQSRPA